jgi:hypothetical protein
VFNSHWRAHGRRVLVLLMSLASVAGVAVASSPPARAASESANSVFVRGADGALWWRQHASAGWSAWQSFGGAIVGNPAVGSSTSRTMVFVRGTDDGLWWQQFDGTSWSGWQSGGGVLTEQPATATVGGTHYVFVRGSDDGLWWQRFDGAGWSGWQYGGGVLTSEPVVVTNGSTVSIFVRGTDDGLWWRRLDGSTLGPWQSGGGVLTSAPAVVASNGIVYVYVRGTDQGLWWRRSEGSSLGPWQWGGGVLASAPAVAASSGSLYVYVRGVDDGLWWRRSNGSTLGPWTARGGVLTADPTGAADGSTVNVFVRGSDNGIYWTQLVGPMQSWSSLAGLSASSQPIGSSGPLINAAPPPPPTGLGFDTCEAPPLTTMRTWRLYSPYTSVGVYFGGRNRTCTNAALGSRVWTSEAVKQGWRLLPIYVGLQAPCTSATRTALMSTDPTTAAQQAREEADDAVTRAAAAGVGRTIYFDMEAYSTNDPGCTAVVQAFMSAWTERVRARGYRAGMYSSLCSGVRDQAAVYDNPGYHRLDVIWIAAWNNRPNIFGFGPPCALSDALWSQQQRIHQYVGEVVETWGGVTLPIDKNAVDVQD